MNNLTSTDFYKKTPYNPETLNQIWMSTIADSHDIWCNCTGPFAHLLASIFPPGHQDRSLTIEQIIQRDYNQQCHSGGTAERNPGSPTATGCTGAGENVLIEGKDFIKDEDLQELIDAGEDATGR